MSGMRSARERISLEQAVDMLLEQVQPLSGAECVPLPEAAERIAFEDIRALLPHPPFDRSPLDGYALHHEDSLGAGRETPARLRVTRQIFAGDGHGPLLLAGEAARIMTGALLPPGADCVIGQEDTDEGEEQVSVYRPVQRLQNICFRGEDVAEGQILVRRGQTLHYAHAGLLAGQGLACARVFRRVRVAILSTGDELAAADQALPPGKIYDSNGVLLAARLRNLGMLPVLSRCCGDEIRLLRGRIESLLEDSDMVITTGGVSVGKRDCMPAVAAALGGRILFHGIDIKPGSPALALAREGKILLCLSGNPYAAAATCEVLAVPALRKLCGSDAFRLRRQTAVCQSEFGKASDMRRLVRARISGEEVFIPPRGHGSGMLRTLAECNCMIDIPAGTPSLQKGTRVEVILL
jgi:molybdopterin molybdotransferase